jgi:hypothetical protein
MLSRVALAFAVALVLVATACDSGFRPPPRPDMKTDIDLASQASGKADMTCLATVCGECSDRVRWDGKPVAVGDPCLVHGTWQCAGHVLECSDASCISCPGKSIGSVCGADGHTVIELNYVNGMCTTVDLNSPIAICNRTADDKCVGRCVLQGVDYTCTARCLSDDGGATAGCPYSPGQTCATLSGC